MTNDSVNFDRASQFYDASRGFPPNIVDQIGPFIKKSAGLKPTDSVLEVGIGTGRIALPVLPHVGRITGVDISTGMMQRLREKTNGEHIDLAQADARQLPFKSHTFDGAMIIHVLHLVPEPERILQELNRTLKPHGYLLHMKNRHGEDSAMQPVRDAWNQFSTPDTRRKDWHEVDNILFKAGWEQINEYHYAYEITTSPAEFLENIEQRLWSSTWEIPDDEHAERVTFLKDIIAQYYDSPYQPCVSMAYFTVQVYHQPR